MNCISWGLLQSWCGQGAFLCIQMGKGGVACEIFLCFTYQKTHTKSSSPLRFDAAKVKSKFPWIHWDSNIVFRNFFFGKSMNRPKYLLPHAWSWLEINIYLIYFTWKFWNSYYVCHLNNKQSTRLAFDVADIQMM